MLIRSTYNGGLAEVSDEEGALLVQDGFWVAASDYVAPAPQEAAQPVKTKRTRRTKAQIEADNAAAAAEAAKTEE
ncbi:hypothetical protein PBI_SHEAKEIRA_17 [Mycobacterium phage SheaKeira]|nr:hypothetical protein PBI_SHEAKEIRA_17 [Mycobacterium phage SheaKeira]